MPKVFVSYSHDSDTHRERVAAFVSRLRREEGISVVWDDDSASVGGPNEGWSRWCERQIIECEFVLACCTEMYCERFDGEQPVDTGKGVAWEAHLIRKYLYNSGPDNRKVRVLLFEEADSAHIPIVLQDYHIFHPANEGSYGQLMGWLKGTPHSPPMPPATPHAPAAPLAAIAWPAAADAFTRRLADRKDEFEIFVNMLSGRSAQRIFLIQGSSSSGKTVLLHECMVYAKHLGVPYAYVDFKGGVPLDDALESLLDLGQNILRESSACLEPARPRTMIADFQRVRNPLLLLFDTYEQTPQGAQNWVETRLLQRIENCPALVVVIAGQKIPEQSGKSWTEFARTVALPPIRRVEDWVDYAGRNSALALIKREHVEAFTFINDGDPGRISAVLEAFAQQKPAASTESGG
jgi:hypothetical protein